MAIVGSVDQLTFRNNIYEIVPEIAPLFQDTESYSSGDWIIYEAGLYEFKANKSAGAWDATKVNGPFTVTGQLSQLKEDLQDLLIRVTASGAVASFSDGADLPLKSLLVNIEPVQSGTGDPSPSNVRPITGWNGVKVTRCGKNLCPPLVDTELTSNGLTLTPNSDGTVRVHGTATNTSAVLLRTKTVSIALGAGAYTFGIGAYPTNNKVYAQCVYSGGALYARVSPKTTTFNDAVTITRIDIGVNAASGENIDITLYPQLEKGSTATPYEPYNGVDVSVDLGQTVYGGHLDVLTGVLTVDRAMVDLGTLHWTRLNTQSPHWRFWAIFTGMLKDSTLMSNQYAQITPSAQWTGAIGIATQLINGTPAVMVTDERYETVADFKTAMSGAQLVYELAEPIAIQLTPNQINSLLGTNNIWADTGDTEVEYRADTKLYIEKLTQPEEDDMVADSAITSGQFFMIGNSLYRALANIASGATITVGTNAQRVSLSDALNLVNA